MAYLLRLQNVEEHNTTNHKGFNSCTEHLMKILQVKLIIFHKKLKKSKTSFKNEKTLSKKMTMTKK